MFFGLAKADFALVRWKAALPFFLLIFLSFLALVSIFTEILKHQITRAELYETEQMVERYLEEKSSIRGQLGLQSPNDRTHLSGLSFVRVARKNDRLLLTTDEIPPRLFKELLHLDLKDSSVWLRRSIDHTEFIWTVVNKELASGSIIQAGKKSEISYQRYQGILHAAYLALAFGFFLALVAGIVCVKKMLSPLQQMDKELGELIEGGRGHLLDAGNSDNELNELYNKINRLLSHNRLLVEEMQGSLDNVAHDLRTPMTRLRSVAEFGLQEDSDSERLRESLADCLEESERVLSMLKIMMSVAEAESGTLRLEREIVDVGQSVGEMIELYEYVAEEKNITLQSTLADGLQVDADRTRISQVWANLLDNAIKYGHEGGLVEVESFSPAPREVCIRFSDNGMGISASEQERIWDRLYRGDRSRSEQGLGLGLNYVKAMVESHGGRVSVTSELHKGSSFYVFLPRSQDNVDLLWNEKSQIKGE